MTTWAKMAHDGSSKSGKFHLWNQGQAICGSSKNRRQAKHIREKQPVNACGLCVALSQNKSWVAIHGLRPTIQRGPNARTKILQIWGNRETQA